MKKLEIKPVQKSELSLLEDLAIQTFRDTYESFNDPHNFDNYLKKAFSSKQLEKEWNDPDSSYYMAWQGSQCVGYFKLNFKKADGNIPANKSVELERIYLTKEKQGQGLGKLLIEGAVYEARLSQDYQWIWLGVWEQNERAIKFYKKNGFSIYGEHLFILGEDKQKDWLMKKAL